MIKNNTNKHQNQQRFQVSKIKFKKLLYNYYYLLNFYNFVNTLNIIRDFNNYLSQD